MNKSLPKSIKLKLEQPDVMCGGRKRIQCYYRAKIVNETSETMSITFISHGSLIVTTYNKLTKEFSSGRWKDLKIV